MSKIKPEGKQTFRLEYNELGAEMKVEIDFDLKIDNSTTDKVIDVIKSMVEFFTDWEYRLMNNKDCYVATFLKQLMKKACQESIGICYNLRGIQSCFNENPPEGYAYLNQVGIKIIDWSYPELDDDDVILTNITESNT